MDGLLLYSDEKKLEVQHFAVDDELEEALDGEIIAMEISTIAVQSLSPAICIDVECQLTKQQ